MKTLNTKSLTKLFVLSLVLTVGMILSYQLKSPSVSSQLFAGAGGVETGVGSGGRIG